MPINLKKSAPLRIVSSVVPAAGDYCICIDWRHPLPSPRKGA